MLVAIESPGNVLEFSSWLWKKIALKLKLWEDKMELMKLTALSTVDDDVNTQITLKLWEDKMELMKLTALGQLVSVYAVTTGIYRNIKHVSNTHDTQIYLS